MADAAIAIRALRVARGGNQTFHGVTLDAPAGNALIGMALGLLAGASARTEFPTEFKPAVVLSQLLLCGLCRRTA